MLIKLQVQSSLLILKSCFRDLWWLPKITDIIQPSLDKLAYKCMPMYICIHMIFLYYHPYANLIPSYLSSFHDIGLWTWGSCSLGKLYRWSTAPPSLFNSKQTLALQYSYNYLRCEREEGSYVNFFVFFDIKTFSDMYRSWLSRKQVILTSATSASPAPTSPAFFFLLWFEFSPHSFSKARHSFHLAPTDCCPWGSCA